MDQGPRYRERREQGPRYREQGPLVYLPSGRVLATVRTYRQAQALASELARLWYRGDGSEPSGNPAPVLQHPA